MTTSTRSPGWMMVPDAGHLVDLDGHRPEAGIEGAQDLGVAGRALLAEHREGDGQAGDDGLAGRQADDLVRAADGVEGHRRGCGISVVVSRLDSMIGAGLDVLPGGDDLDGGWSGAPTRDTSDHRRPAESRKTPTKATMARMMPIRNRSRFDRFKVGLPSVV